MTRKSSTWNKKPGPLKFHAEGRRAVESGAKTETRRLVKADNSRVYPGKFHGVDLESGRRVDHATDVEAIRARCAFVSGRIRTVTIEPVYRPGMRVRMAGGRAQKDGPPAPMLEILAVRAARVQDMGPADFIAEGIVDPADAAAFDTDGLRRLFAKRWDKIYGPGSWVANPWVWIYKFRKAEGPKP